MKLGEMTPQEQEFMNMLDKHNSLSAQVSFSYCEVMSAIQGRLKDFYCGRADWNRCIKKYFSDEEYQKECRILSDLSSVPELTEDDIRNRLTQEAEDDRSIEELKSLQKAVSKVQRDQKLAPELYRAAELLGILPNSNQGLNSWFVDRSGLTEEEKRTILQKMGEKNNTLSIIINLLIDHYYDGVYASFPQNGTILTQSKRRYYYRGECAYYGSSKSSLARSIKESIPKDILTFLLLLRFHEVCHFLNHFDAILKWPYERMVSYQAIAQHYGFKTRIMDVTNDFRTALFFACCEWDKVNNIWIPLKRERIAEVNSRKESVPPNGDCRYGILYQTPSAITDMMWGLDEKEDANIITPIGYQPFMRCSAQHGYMLFPKNPSYDMMKDPLFSKFKIRLSEDLCQWIYKEMDCGEKVYPRKRDVPEIGVYFENINQTKIFSEEAFQNAMEELHIPKKEYESTKEKLKKYDIYISKESYVISYHRIQKINKQYPVEKALQSVPFITRSRPILHLPADTLVQVDEKGQIIIR